MTVTPPEWVRYTDVPGDIRIAHWMFRYVDDDPTSGSLGCYTSWPLDRLAPAHPEDDTCPTCLDREIRAQARADLPQPPPTTPTPAPQPPPGPKPPPPRPTTPRPPGATPRHPLP